MTQEEGEKMYKRRQSREVSVGNVKIGGNNPCDRAGIKETRWLEVRGLHDVCNIRTVPDVCRSYCTGKDPEGCDRLYE